jgi:hypothetical protein
MLRGFILSRRANPRNIGEGSRRNGASRSRKRADSRCIYFLLSRFSGGMFTKIFQFLLKYAPGCLQDTSSSIFVNQEIDLC